MAVGVAKRLDCASASNRQRQSHPIMKNGKDFVLTLVTAPNLKTARKLAKLALDAHLIACANLVPRIESHYWWQGKIESSAEVLIVMKTAAVRLAKLERLILAQHPYDTAEIIAVPLSAGTDRYLTWMAESVGGLSKKSKAARKSARAQSSRRHTISFD